MNIYLTKEYDYRRWYILFGGMLASVFGAVILFYCVIPSAKRADWHGSLTIWSILGPLLSFGIPMLLLSAGLWIIHSWMIRRVNRLEVSDIGVRYGASFRNWEEIKWFSCHQLERGKQTLFYQKKGVSCDYNLMVTDPLSEDEIACLFENLQRDVLPFHPELEIG
jgi:hypothetical protein